MDLLSQLTKLYLDETQDESAVPVALDLWYDLSSFPDHILVEIFKNVDNKSKCNLALVCKKFNEIIKTVPEIYKTFEVNESQLLKFLSARIDTIPDRPIPSIKFNTPLEYLHHFLDGLFTLFPTYLEKQGQFVTNICLIGLVIDYNLLIKILNLIPNAEVVYIFVTRFQNPVRQEGHHSYYTDGYPIEKELEELEAPEPVKNRFLKLKSLKFYIYDLQNFDRYPIELFYEFFKDSKEITELGLSHNLNLFYNKPKLEKMYVVNNHRSDTFNTKLNMDKASESNVIFGNLKKVWLEGAVFHKLENLKNLEIFIMSQNQIKEVSLIDLRIPDDFLLVENFVNRVAVLKSLKKMNFFTIPLNIETMRSHLSIEELSTDFEIYQEIYAHFPNLKKLAIKGKITGNDQISAINQAPSLEELTIDYAYETFRGAVDFIPIQLPNLKKLVVQERSFSKKIMDEFALNSPNIVEISFGLDGVMNEDNLFVHANNMKTFKKLKRYSCSFLIDDFEFDKIENFSMLMEAGKCLEQFEVKLAPVFYAHQIWKKRTDFLATFKPYVKLVSQDSVTVQAKISEIVTPRPSVIQISIN